MPKEIRVIYTRGRLYKEFETKICDLYKVLGYKCWGEIPKSDGKVELLFHFEKKTGE